MFFGEFSGVLNDYADKRFNMDISLIVVLCCLVREAADSVMYMFTICINISHSIYENKLLLFSQICNGNKGYDYGNDTEDILEDLRCVNQTGKSYDILFSY